MPSIEVAALTDRYRRRQYRFVEHALESTQTTSWATFAGKYAGGGNHRGSIFRLHVGRALIEKHGWHDEYPHWGEPNPDAETTAVREQEHELEQRVSEYIRDLPFLWVDVPGKPGPECDRAVIESHTIAMVSRVSSICRAVRPRLARVSLAEIRSVSVWAMERAARL
ncbi:hypothetical protein ACODNH_00615 (plasmid) [Haloarcula sp. NS06]|uniref:hypothetical protein n=1 Tax=Haloarcula sp. NS06 TaxID=3409688 RepID=UPI003DA73BDE